MAYRVYNVWLREPARPNCVMIRAHTPQEAKRQAEAKGLTVRSVSPVLR
jgi:hypothetical protein